MILIVDYKMGNLGSIQNMFRKLGLQAELSSDWRRLKDATKIVLPGVGRFPQAMENLKSLDLIEPLSERVMGEGVSTLGICLGMQLMTEQSAEGDVAGLGWIAGETKKFDFPSDSDLRVPHMGWNQLRPVKNHVTLDGLNEDSRFYFVHSYYVALKNKEDLLTETDYGLSFASGFNRGNLTGFQFHPEKSHRYGMNLFRNFAGQSAE